MPRRRPMSARDLARFLQAGCTLVNEHVNPDGETAPVATAKTFPLRSLYAPDGSYIEDVGPEGAKVLRVLLKHGILRPERAQPEENVACIGRGADGKWYGWSHRLIAGFGIGDAVRVGDVAFVPSGPEEFRADYLKAWEGRKDRLEVHLGTEDSSALLVTWTVRGKARRMAIPYPSPWGRGAWMAETDADARQMAIDVAHNES